MNLYFNSDKSVFLLDPNLENIIWSYQTISGALTKVPYFAEIIAPSYGTRAEPKVMLDILELGDGYEQVTELGIRPIRRMFSVTFGKKRPQVARALERFFTGEQPGSIYERRPSEYFWFKVPVPFGDADAQPVKFRCQTWTMEPNTYSAVTMTAQFIESFEP